jgi:hypothetical protein
VWSTALTGLEPSVVPRTIRTSRVYAAGYRGFWTFASLEIFEGMTRCRVITGTLVEHRAPDVPVWTVRANLPGLRRVFVLTDEASERCVSIYPWFGQQSSLTRALGDAGFTVRDRGARLFAPRRPV